MDVTYMLIATVRLLILGIMFYQERNGLAFVLR